MHLSRRGTDQCMTSTPGDPTHDPNIEPDELPDGSPSRPQGDPVMPDPNKNPAGDPETDAGL